jgi:Flp pilus assembly protein TadG
MRIIRQDERGATIVIVALSIVALLTMTGLAIDGGRLYSDRRQVQNAADAAALAGTVALNTLVAGNEASIYNAVQARVNENQAFDSFTCQIIDEAGNVLQSCPTGNGTAINGAAAGVKVVAKNTQNTSFMRAAGVDTFSASANAAATLQRLVPSGGAGPIMVCGVLKGDPRWGPDNSGDEQTPPILLADDSLNPAALYNPATGLPSYWIKGVEVKKTCSQGANWKGLSDGGTYSLPGAWHTDNGNKAGPTRVKVAGACGDPEVVGCRVVLPICYWKAGVGEDPWMWCVRFAVFQITFSDSNSIKAGIIGNAVVEGGQGGGKPADPIEPRLIKLIQ